MNDSTYPHSKPVAEWFARQPPADAAIVLDDGSQFPTYSFLFRDEFRLFGSSFFECKGPRRLRVPGPRQAVTSVLHAGAYCHALDQLEKQTPSLFAPTRLPWFLKRHATTLFPADAFEACVRVADFLQWHWLETFLLTRASTLSYRNDAEALYRVLENVRLECSERVQDVCLKVIVDDRLDDLLIVHPLAPVRATLDASPEPDLITRLVLLTDLMSPFARIGAPLLPIALARALCCGQDPGVDFAGASLPTHAIEIGPFSRDQALWAGELRPQLEHMGHTWSFRIQVRTTSINGEDVYDGIEPVLRLARRREGAAEVEATFKIVTRRFHAFPPYFSVDPWAFLAGDNDTSERTHRFTEADDRFVLNEPQIGGGLGSVGTGCDPFGNIFAWVEFIACT